MKRGTMKRRSEVAKPKVVLHCAECGQEQKFLNPKDPAAPVCKSNHADAPSISASEAAALFPVAIGAAVARLIGMSPGDLVDTKGATVLDVSDMPKVRVVETRVSTPKSTGIPAIDEVDKKRRAEKLEAESKKLRDEMAKADEKEVLDPLRWGSANKAEESQLDSGFLAIVETLVVDDPMAYYGELEKALVVGDKRTDYGTVMKHLDEAEKNARMAHRLWQSGRIEQKRWELENEVVHSAIRREATRSLQHEKESGTRAKMVTDADVESRMASLFPDEYRAQGHKRAKVRSMVDSLQNLAEVWMSRCKSLQVILSKQR
jgi:hypothetical protein